jgi:hypothetical protein
VLGEEGLEDHRVLAGRAVDGVGQRVLRRQAQCGGAVAELHVEVDEHGRLRRGLGEPQRQVGGHGRLAHPALRRGDGDDPAVVALGLVHRTQHPAAAGSRRTGPLHGGADLGGVGVRGEQVADAGPHGGLPHLRRRVRHEDDGDAGALDVESRRQREHLRRRRVRPHEQHVGQLPVEELLEQPGGVAGQAARGQHGDVALRGLLDPQDQVLAGSGQYDAAHRGTPT